MVGWRPDAGAGRYGEGMTVATMRAELRLKVVGRIQLDLLLLLNQN